MWKGESKNRVVGATITSIQILSFSMFSLPTGMHLAVPTVLGDFLIAMTQNLTRSNLKRKVYS